MRKFKILLGVAAFIGALYVARVPVYEYSTARNVDFTVQRVERVTNADGNGAKYLVWSQEGDTYQNIDSFWWLKYNSSDVQGQLVPGKKITAKISGLRFGFFSWYPNIIEVEKAE